MDTILSFYHITLPTWVNAWTLTRAAGLGCYLLLTLSVLSGLYQSIRTKQQKPTPIAAILHQSLARWSLYLVLVHLILLAYDNYSQYTWTELLVPLKSHLDPIPMAFGIIAFYLLIVTIITTEARTKIGLKLWRKLHMASPVLYLLSTVHGITNGTDTLKYVPMYLLSASSVILLLLVRFVLIGRKRNEMASTSPVSTP